MEAGQHYERSAGIWDGRWSTYRKCKYCMDFESAFDAVYKGFMHSSSFGQMLDDAKECMSDIFSVDHPGRWFRVARKLVAIKRNHDNQIKKAVLDKAGRGVAYRPNQFWYTAKHKNHMARIRAQLDQEKQRETRTETTLG